jgi:hypothetical protein
VTSSSATAPAANGDRTPAPRARPLVPAGAGDDDLVQQLASLGKTQPKPGATRPQAGREAGESETDPKADHEGEGSADGNGDEPINRGMLLKFLSSVRP